MAIYYPIPLKKPINGTEIVKAVILKCMPLLIHSICHNPDQNQLKNKKIVDINISEN